jgi:hypothetical protein
MVPGLPNSILLSAAGGVIGLLLLVVVFGIVYVRKRFAEITKYTELRAGMGGAELGQAGNNQAGANPMLMNNGMPSGMPGQAQPHNVTGLRNWSGLPNTQMQQSAAFGASFPNTANTRLAGATTWVSPTGNVFSG